MEQGWATSVRNIRVEMLLEADTQVHRREQLFAQQSLQILAASCRPGAINAQMSSSLKKVNLVLCDRNFKIFKFIRIFFVDDVALWEL